jgi:putative ABC transport system permease protein
MESGKGAGPGWLFLMAWRDSRRNRGRLFLFISSVVLGIAALVATLSFGNNLRDDVDDQVKDLVGADLVIFGNRPLPPTIRKRVDSVATRHSEERSLASMVYFFRTQASRLVQLRGIQGDYPYYGRLETEPGSAGMGFRGSQSALVDKTLMLQFGAKVGDSIRVGDLSFRIVGALVKSPGRNEISLTVAPPVYIPLKYLDSAGLEKKGSIFSTQTFYQVKAGTDVDKLMAVLGPQLDSARVGHETVESRKAGMTRAFADLTQFLTLISFIALLMGCIGVASAVNIYIREKIAGVAVLRCLGLKARQAFLIYLIQVAGIGLIGSLLGAALGVVVQQVLPAVLKDFLPLESHFRISWAAIGEGIGTGMVIALMFALLPLLTVRKISPLYTLRLSVESMVQGWDGWKGLVYAIIFGSIVFFSYIRMRNFGKALVFTLTILGAFLVLAGAARLLMAVVRRLFPERWNYLWRQGFANLYRPNNQTLILIVTIGLGTTFIGTLYFVQQLLLDRVTFAAGSTQGNMVLFDIQPDQLAGVRKLAGEYHLPVVQEVPIVTARIVSVNGKKSEEEATPTRPAVGPGANGEQAMAPGGGGSREERGGGGEAGRGAPREEGGGRRRVFGREVRVTYRDSLLSTEKLIAGRLGPRVSSPKDGIYISLDQDFANRIRVKIGDSIGFDIQGLPVSTVVGSLRQVEGRLRLNFPILFPAGVLEQAPQFHLIATEVPSAEVSARFQRAVVQQFPGISVIDLQLILNVLENILGKIGFVVRFMAAFSMLTGVIVLIASVLVSKYQRIQESVLLRTLGASRRQVLVITMLEYFFLGGLAALVGIGLSMGFSLGLAKFIFDGVYVPHWWVATGLFVGVSGLTVLIGLYNSRGVLNRPPLEVLRREG